MENKRQAEITRKTRETSINLLINLDGSGQSSINTGIGFLDHMLELFAKHGFFDLTVEEKGDLHVDYHHSMEDLGLARGSALAQALGDKAGIRRYGSCLLPMDEALAFCALDISGRAYLHFDAAFTNQSVGAFDCCLVEEFFRAFAMNSGITLHIRLEYGSNDHHKIEAIFKAVAHALQIAVTVRDGGVLSSKGVLA